MESGLKNNATYPHGFTFYVMSRYVFRYIVNVAWGYYMEM